MSENRLKRLLDSSLVGDLAVVLGPLLLLAPVWLSGQAIYYGTPYLQFVPWRHFAWDLLAQGQLPLWNPLVGMGAPLAANYQSALFYPPNFSLWLLDRIGGLSLHAWGQTLLLAAHLGWAGLGMSRLMHRLGVGATGQAAAGLAFGLSSYLVTRAGFLSINAAAAWLPWVVYFVEGICQRAANRQNPTGAAFQSLGLAVCLGLQLLAGHAQTTWYTLVLAGIWLAASSLRAGGWRNLARAAAWMAAGGLLAGLLAGVQLAPTAEYLSQSQRAGAVDYEYAVNYSFWPWRFLSLLAPDLFGNPAQGDYWFNVFFWEDAVYVGLLPLMMALGAVLGRGQARADRVFEDEDQAAAKQAGDRPVPAAEFSGGRTPAGLWKWVLLGICLGSFVLALGRYTPVFPFLYRNVPTFDMFQAPTRWSLLAVFGLAALAGLGADRWRRPERRALYWTRLGTAGAVAVMLGAGAGWVALGDVRPTFIRAIALAGFWAVGAGVLALLAPRAGAPVPAGWRAAVTGWILLDLLAAGWGANPGVPVDLYRQTAARAGGLVPMELSEGRMYIPPEVEEQNKFERFFRVESYQPAEDPLGLSEILLPNSAMLAGIPGANNFDPLVPGRYARWMEIVAEMDEMEREPWLAWMGVSAVQRLDPGSASGVRYQRVSGWQRLRWAECGVAVEGEGEALNRLLEQADPGGRSVILEGTGEDVVECGSQSAQPARFQVVSEQAGRLVVSLDAPDDGWLVLADSWYPGWSARVDGVEQPLLRADYLFRAVALVEGEHQVEFRYRPASFFLGAGLSAAGLTILLISLWRLNRSIF